MWFLSILLASIIGATPMAVFAQDETDAQPVEKTHGPRLVCDEPTYNFGDRDSGQNVEHTFVLRNEGDYDLEITKVRPACGCTVANLSNKTIHPGEEARIQTKLSLRGRKGRQRKSITVESNDPDHPRFLLYLDGVVSQELQATPSQVIFGRVNKHSDSTKTITIAAHGKPFVVSRVEATDKQFSAELETIETGKQYKIHVRLNPPMQTGRHRGHIRVSSENPDQPDMNIPVSATVVGPLIVAPREIVLAKVKDQPVTRYVVLRPGEVPTFSVTHVETPHPEMTSQVTTIAGNGVRIQLNNIIATADLDGKQLRIVTDAEGMEEILIPFRVIAR